MHMVTVAPISTMVPISAFSNGKSAQAFAKVSSGMPVTVLKNNQPMYFIIDREDFERYQSLEEQLQKYIEEAIENKNEEARRQVQNHEFTHESHTASDMMDYLNGM